MKEETTRMKWGSKKNKKKAKKENGNVEIVDTFIYSKARE